MDSEAGVDLQVIDNFFDIEDQIEKLSFYGIAAKIIGDEWQAQAPDETEPFFIRIYDYEEDFVPADLEAPVTGTYELALRDSWDHWDWGEGSFVSVYVNDEPVIENATMLAGDPDPLYHSFEASEGDEISTVYSAGSWANENYYAILDPDGVILAEEGGTWDNPGESIPGNINPAGVFPIDPVLENPHLDLYMDAQVVDTDDLLVDAFPIYRFDVYFDSPVELESGWLSAQIDADNGSGTWFLWLSSPVGDNMAYQIDHSEEKVNYHRDMVSRAGMGENGALLRGRDALEFDLAYKLWGGVLTDPPMCATNPNPEDEAENLDIHGNLSWTGDPVASGYRLYFGTVGGEWDLVDGDDLGMVTSYAFTALDYDTEYEWKVVPYNVAGDAEDCPVWTFTTVEDPTLTPPFTEQFAGADFPPLNWDRWTGVLSEDTELDPVSLGWIHGRFGNESDINNNTAKINISGERNHWLTTPPVDLGDGGYQLEFDIALTTRNSTESNELGPDDHVAFVISRDAGQTWSEVDVLADWASGDPIPNTGERIILDITDETGIVKFGMYAERPGGTEPDIDFFFTNFQVRTPPGSPTFLISNEEWDFGVVGPGEEEARVFTIRMMELAP